MTKHEALPVGQVIGYASGNFGKSLQNTTIGLVYLYFLVEVLLIPAPLAGNILLLSLSCDAIAAPMLGHFIDRYIGKSVTYKQMVLIASPICMMFYIAMFLLPITFTNSTIFWVIIGTFLFRLSYTLVDVPHNSMLAGITQNSRERTRLSSYRFFFSSAGSITISIVLTPVLKGGKFSESASFVDFALLTGIIYLIVMQYSALMTKTRLTKKSNKKRETTGIKSIKELFSNNQYLRVLLVCTISAGSITVFSSMSLFYAKSWLGDASLAPFLISAHYIGQILILPTWLRLSASNEKKTVATYAYLLFGITMLLFLIFSPVNIWVCVVFFCIAGAALSGLTVMNWSMIPDTVEYTETISGSRHEALTFGILTTTNKIALGFSIALIGWTLGLSGYEASSGSSGTQLSGILYVMTLAPLIGSALCVYILAKLNMNYEDHSRLQSGVEN